MPSQTFSLDYIILYYIILYYIILYYIILYYIILYYIILHYIILYYIILYYIILFREQCRLYASSGRCHGPFILLLFFRVVLRRPLATRSRPYTTSLLGPNGLQF